ncbi:MAG: hypothetical protein HXX19_08005 [Rhodoferax sp.]|nr:hypothetical protein [Rhodoferax sp.]
MNFWKRLRLIGSLVVLALAALALLAALLHRGNSDADAPSEQPRPVLHPKHGPSGL